MHKTLQIIDWNISYMNDWEKKMEFLFSKLNNDYCVILQEVGPYVAQCIREKYAEENSFVYSLDYRKLSKYDSGARRLGVMLIFSKSIEVLENGVIERNFFPDRTAWAGSSIAGRWPRRWRRTTSRPQIRRAYVPIASSVR